MQVSPAASGQLRLSTGDTVRTSLPTVGIDTAVLIEGKVDFAATGDISFNKAITGTGTGEIRQLGTGRLLMSEDSEFTGSIHVSNGSLHVTNSTGSATGTASVEISGNGILSGSGRIGGPVSIFDGGQLSPGESPGTLAFDDDLTWGDGGSLLWEINNAIGTAGVDPGWDWIDVTGKLSILADPGNPFIIEIASLNLLNISGAISEFDVFSNYTWTIATSGQLPAYDPASLFLNTTDFYAQNPDATGTLSLGRDGENLKLFYTPIPEPRTYALLFGITILALATTSKRRKSKR